MVDHIFVINLIRIIAVRLESSCEKYYAVSRCFLGCILNSMLMFRGLVGFIWCI